MEHCQFALGLLQKFPKNSQIYWVQKSYHEKGEETTQIDQVVGDTQKARFALRRINDLPDPLRTVELLNIEIFAELRIPDFEQGTGLSLRSPFPNCKCILLRAPVLQLVNQLQQWIKPA